MESSQVLARTKSLFLIAARLNDKSARTMNQAVIKSLGKIDTSRVNTMIFDNGKEFSDFRLRESLQFFPKMTDFDEIAGTELDRKVELLNNHPRKCLGCWTPAEIFVASEKRCASN
jgi:IS30 family transposase